MQEWGGRGASLLVTAAHALSLENPGSLSLALQDAIGPRGWGSLSTRPPAGWPPCCLPTASPPPRKMAEPLWGPVGGVWPCSQTLDGGRLDGCHAARVTRRGWPRVGEGRQVPAGAGVL